jgi:signal transduction histidine kinase
MQIRFWNRIAVQQGRNAFVVGLVLGVLSGSVQIVSDFVRREDQIRSNVTQRARLVQDSAAQAAYNVDSDLAGKAISGLIQYWPVRQVQVIDDFGTVLSSRESPGASGKAGMLSGRIPWGEDSYSIPLFYFDKDLPVGRLKVTLDRNKLIGRFVRESVFVIGKAVITAMLLAFALSLLFYRSLASPLLRIIKEVAQVDVKNPGEVRLKKPVFHKHDELGLLVLTVNKLLERIRAQNMALVDANVALEKRVEERTKELKNAEEKLVRAEKLAVIGKLAGSIAHELRTPLGVLKNTVYYLNLKLRGKIGEKIDKHLGIMEDEIHVSNRIISDVLTYGRVKEPEKSETDLNHLMYKALSKIDIPENIRVATDLQGDLEKIDLDEFQVEQVFSNLITNAVQSMEEGGDLVLGTSREDGCYAARITDSGEGIPRENIPRIFEPLFSTKITGTGLGLPICKNIVEMHKGSIDIESREGRGTTVTVRFPILEDEDTYE